MTIHFLYNIALSLAYHLCRRLARFFKVPSTKLQRFIHGQAHAFQDLESYFINCKDSRHVYWIHAASYGEYNAVRPIIQKMHEQGTYQIVLTFFSATGVDIVKYRHEITDAVFFLPLDTKKNVKRFFELVKPQRCTFVISEYWINYLDELRKRHIPAYLISAHITRKAPFMRWYGGMFRRALKAFKMILVLDKNSIQLLEEIGFTNTILTGDPLFDNVATRAAAPYHNAIIERFVKDQKVLIAGSITELRDLYMISGLAKLNPETKFIIVPHEITSSYLRNIQLFLHGKAQLYSDCNEQTDFSNTQALIIDFMGALIYLYRYADMAYVGGGFTRTLHSVVEASVYGIPVAFGPRAERQQTAYKLLEYGIGYVVHRVRDINKWYQYMQQHPNDLEAVKQHANAMMLHHKGASASIAKIITENE